MRGPAPLEDASLQDLVARLARSLAMVGADASVQVGGAREGHWMPLGVSHGRILWAVADRDGRITTLIAGPGEPEAPADAAPR